MSETTPDRDTPELGASVDTDDLNGDSAVGSSIERPPAATGWVSGGRKTTPALMVEGGAEAQHEPALPYPVVGFGASTGGLSAFREVLESLSPDTGMAFVLVTHLSTDHRSYLTEIVKRYTRIPVIPVEHGATPLPDHIYILLPNQLLRLRRGVFQVEERGSGGRRSIPVIDEFFRSLASDQKNHAIGVVLSGADGDGASGLKTIKGEGGIALVQSPETAESAGMPRSSIAADHVDLVVPPSEIALELGRLAYQFAKPEVRSLEDGNVAANDEQAFQKILQLVRTQFGIDLRQYKPDTIRRRVARRMVLLRQNSLTEYYRFLQVRSDEVRLLHEDLLINVTRFFRDPDVWESLRENVLPVLVEGRTPDHPIRIWCAGCSTGEEAYSLAITVLEYLSEKGLDIPIQVFGTDASEQSIESARAAIYPETLAEEIAPERLRRYFIKVDRGYQVSKRVRDSCIFARQNLCSDPPFSHIDVLSCRNVMIYFTQPLQRQVVLTFHYALDPGGYMLLGMSEGLRDYSDLFSTVDRKHKLYMKTAAAVPYVYQSPRTYSLGPIKGLHRTTPLGSETASWPELELQRAADRIVVAYFGPPGLIVDAQMNVLQARGQVAQFLDIAPGTVTWSLPRVLREYLAAPVEEALERAMQENVPAGSTAVLLEEGDGTEKQVRIDVVPITSSVARSRCFLILFQAPADPVHTKLLDAPGLSHLGADEKERLIAQLRQNLTSTRFHLQSLVEGSDARNQELLSTNEEIQSANEELQSTNEELETTKEELQSANEELQTVNEELQQRNSILAQTGNDLTNLLHSVNIPLLMLTSDFRIRQFTPPMQRLLSVRPSDVGRSILEIRLHLSLDDIEPILSDVLDTLETREQEVQDREGKWYLLRVRPYRTSENKIEGLVVLLLDIDQLRKNRQDLLEAREFASAVVESMPVAIAVLDQSFTIRTANTALRNLAGLPPRGIEGRVFPDLVQVLWGADSVRERLDNLAESPNGTVLRFEYESPSPGGKILSITGQALLTDGDRVFLLLLEDITLRREAERLIAHQKEALESEVELAAHNLSRTREELHGLTAHLFTAHEEERQYVARELHDDIGQRLSLIEILITELDISKWQPEDAEKVTAIRSQVHELNSGVRQLSHRLHPAILKDLGLASALNSLVEEFGRRERMPASFLSQNLPERFAAATETALYRIAQEALRNVAKHAGKTHVKVILEARENMLELRVMDFGLGFDTESEPHGSGLGLVSMQERARMAAGTFDVQSSLGIGTTVTVTVPLEPSE